MLIEMKFKAWIGELTVDRRLYEPHSHACNPCSMSLRSATREVASEINVCTYEKEQTIDPSTKDQN